jgi:molybdopterin-biosynthesis enzyme MoeA-like protein
MNFGLIVIGDEILSGKRQDKHFPKVVELLAARGLQLSWAEYLGDDRVRLVEVLRRSFASGDAVFSCGGIGATPDDHTRQAAGIALDLSLALHPEAARLIARRTAEMAATGQAASADMNRPENRQRLRMGEFPTGSGIIPNPFNQIPGFEIRNHFFVPGFPVMAWPMIEWVLDHRFADLFHRERQAERSFLAFELAESVVTPLLEEIEREFAGVRVFSLPSVAEDGRRRHIELGVKGPEHLVGPAFARLEAGTRLLGAEIG